MSIASGFSGQNVVVLGLGRTGKYAALALKAGGATVWAWDDVESMANKAEQEGITILPADKIDWRTVAAMVVSPGVPHKYPKPHPMVSRALNANVPLLSDIDLLGRCYPKARYIGITGTNGKTTTTSLIGQVLSHAGLTVHVAGNIGTSVFSFDVISPEDTFVLEMSSYQLELTNSICFDAAVLLNITPDHLVRHGGLQAYIAAKQRIFARQTARQLAVVGVDTPLSEQVYTSMRDATSAQLVPVSGHKVVSGGVYIKEGVLIDDAFAKQRQIVDLKTIPALSAPHNGQNAAAAYVVARRIGVDASEIIHGLSKFQHLPHRQEVVATYQGVSYINDSKATNVDAAKQALAHFNPIYWIAGGQFKEESLDELYPHLQNVRHAYLIGEAAEQFKGWLDNRVPTTVAGTLEVAVQQASKQALQDGHADAVVLLSPACASFDQFKDFEVRGEAFRACAHAQEPRLKTGSR